MGRDRSQKVKLGGVVDKVDKKIDETATVGPSQAI
jgi:hypothetical protein